MSFLYDWDVPPTEADLQGGYGEPIGYFFAQPPQILEVNEPEDEFLGYSATVLYNEAALDTDELVFTDLQPDFAIDSCLQALEELKRGG